MFFLLTLNCINTQRSEKGGTIVLGCHHILRLSSILDVSLCFGTTADCINVSNGKLNWSWERCSKRLKMLQPSSLCLQKKKRGFAFLSTRQVGCIKKCKGRSKMRTFCRLSYFLFFSTLSFWKRNVARFFIEEVEESTLLFLIWLLNWIFVLEEKNNECKSRNFKADYFFR